MSVHPNSPRQARAPTVLVVVRNDRKRSDEETCESRRQDEPLDRSAEACQEAHEATAFREASKYRRPAQDGDATHYPFDYTLPVLRGLLALLLIVLVGTLSVVDPFFCPDGCGDEPIDVDFSPSGGTDCSTCHGLGPITPSQRVARVELVVSSWVRLVPTTTSAPPRAIEHPPRPV